MLFCDKSANILKQFDEIVSSGQNSETRHFRYVVPIFRRNNETNVNISFDIDLITWILFDHEFLKISSDI